MGKKDVLTILRHLMALLEQKNVHVDRLILFGSWAKGTQREGSYIDVVVISNDFNGKDYWARIQILSDVIYQVFAPIQAVALTPDEWERGENTICQLAENGEVIPA